ncbi:hypothetical protein O181_124566 [Austropuccinia psidii MF-1]|uniref:Uncharacterized protein n=1 Tax=Austropuccinia psidii MF-1 TaxID=1389203 RepID=A0A9Q3KQP9_9BASI|nr:hypothetical protein [Austropuccinia psidii MF-1]
MDSFVTPLYSKAVILVIPASLTQLKMPENPTRTIPSRIVTMLPVGCGTDQSKAISQPIWLQPQRVRCSGTQTVIFQPDLSTCPPV